MACWSAINPTVHFKGSCIQCLTRPRPLDVETQAFFASSVPKCSPQQVVLTQRARTALKAHIAELKIASKPKPKPKGGRLPKTAPQPSPVVRQKPQLLPKPRAKADGSSSWRKLLQTMLFEGIFIFLVARACKIPNSVLLVGF